MHVDFIAIAVAVYYIIRTKSKIYLIEFSSSGRIQLKFYNLLAPTTHDDDDDDDDDARFCEFFRRLLLLRTSTVFLTALITLGRA